MSTKVDPAENPKVERHVRAFLKALNSSGGKPLETMSPADARQVLVGAQACVELEFAPCDIEDRTITQDGIDVPITIVRPDYGLLNALSQVPAVRDALHQAAEMLRKHLK